MTKLNRQPASRPRKTVTLAEVRRIAKAKGYGTVRLSRWIGADGRLAHYAGVFPGDERYIGIDHPSRSVALAQMKAALLAAGGGR